MEELDWSHYSVESVTALADRLVEAVTGDARAPGYTRVEVGLSPCLSRNMPSGAEGAEMLAQLLRQRSEYVRLKYWYRLRGVWYPPHVYVAGLRVLTPMQLLME